nr:hypothetical protein [Pseudomonas syringae group genomosp. 7]
MTTILVVDDEYLIADILSFALEDEGLMVVSGNGEQWSKRARGAR